MRLILIEKLALDILNIKNTFEFIGGVYRLESGNRQENNRQQIIVVMDKGIYDTFEKRGDLFS